MIFRRADGSKIPAMATICVNSPSKKDAQERCDDDFSLRDNVQKLYKDRFSGIQDLWIVVTTSLDVVPFFATFWSISSHPSEWREQTCRLNKMSSSLTILLCFAAFLCLSSDLMIVTSGFRRRTAGIGRGGGGGGVNIKIYDGTTSKDHGNDTLSSDESQRKKRTYLTTYDNTGVRKKYHRFHFLFPGYFSLFSVVQFQVCFLVETLWCS